MNWGTPALPSFSGVIQVLRNVQHRKHCPILLSSASHSLGLNRPVFEAHHSPLSIAWARIVYCCDANGNTLICLFVFGTTAPQQAKASSFMMFLDHTQRRNTFGRTPLDEWSARRRDLYLTTHNTHNRQISMPLVGFEPTISVGERP